MFIDWFFYILYTLLFYAVYLWRRLLHSLHVDNRHLSRFFTFIHTQTWKNWHIDNPAITGKSTYRYMQLPSHTRFSISRSTTYRWYMHIEPGYVTWACKCQVSYLRRFSNAVIICKGYSLNSSTQRCNFGLL